MSKDERVCIDSTSDQMCGITKCEDFKGEEVCPIGRSCDTSRGTATCVCSEGTYEIEGGACASPYSREHCGINPVNPGFACTSEGQLCDGTKCICPPNFSNCTDSNDNTECTDLSHDRYNCGSCNNDCTTHDPNAICKNFECVCPDTHVKCNGKCIDPKTDANYCGAKASCTDDAMGMTCGTNQLCNDGKCKCNDGFVDVDLDDSTPPKCVAIDTQPHAEYSKYCGITDVTQTIAIGYTMTAAKMTSLRSITAENARIVALSDVINMATDVKTSASQIPAQTKNRVAQRANSNLYTT